MVFIPNVLRRERQREKTHTEEDVAVATEAETGIMQPQARECQPPAARSRKRQEAFLPGTSGGGAALLAAYLAQ